MNRRNLKYLFELFGFLTLLFKLFIPARKLKILSIYFHNPSPELFESIVKYLIVKGYGFISLDQFNVIIDKGKLNEKVAIITIDDGWQKNKELLEIIRKYKVYIAIFVTTSAIEEGNFWFEFVGLGNNNSINRKQEVIRIKKLYAEAYYSEISNLKSGTEIGRSALTREELILTSSEMCVTIGSHTVSHISLPNKQIEIQKRELIESKKKLEQWTGKKVEYFSYPSGDYSEEQKKLAKECGYKLCFTTETSYLELNRIDKYAIPRRCVNDDAGFYEAISKIYGIWYKIKK